MFRSKAMLGWRSRAAPSTTHPDIRRRWPSWNVSESVLSRLVRFPKFKSGSATLQEKTMYQKPKVIAVGQVEKVVLGTAPVGADLDGTYAIADLEYEREGDEVEIDETDSQ